MTRRELLARLAWVPLLGPALHRLGAVPQLPPIRQGVTFTRVTDLKTALGPIYTTTGEIGWRFVPRLGDLNASSDPAWGSRFLLSPLWRGWIENARGQMIAFVKHDWSVWGTP